MTRFPALAEAPVDTARQFAEDVARDLRKRPKELQSKYLYDALGSSLFEAICRLPWYRITRAEMRLLGMHAADVVSAIRGPATLVELGCGSGEKITLIIDALERAGRSARVHLIDISEQALEQSGRALDGREHVSVVGHRSTYEQGLRQAALLREAADAGGQGPPGQQTTLTLLLGSNIGNFDEPAASEFLMSIRRALRSGDLFLLGADLVKPERDLLAAYDDPLGVTAAFNKNLLVRINGELGGTFDLDGFDHRAVWNSHARRVEMHLVSRFPQQVEIAGAGLRVSFAAGETIWTESSYKYDAREIITHGAQAGFRLRRQWIESSARFALTLFDAA
ncbi:MAG TPA: L-histidine N(alpha)-methyltransferase [Vicinamibacterales bacterium]|jgi:dimethylhistidine N-methyltransferase|nr:L-histidine N(alpha)-methyltransferase [Vicinamibacterales bacterium]